MLEESALYCHAVGPTYRRNRKLIVYFPNKMDVKVIRSGDFVCIRTLLARCGPNAKAILGVCCYALHGHLPDIDRPVEESCAREASELSWNVFLRRRTDVLFTAPTKHGLELNVHMVGRLCDLWLRLGAPNVPAPVVDYDLTDAWMSAHDASPSILRWLVRMSARDSGCLVGRVLLHKRVPIKFLMDTLRIERIELTSTFFRDVVGVFEGCAADPEKKAVKALFSFVSTLYEGPGVRDVQVDASNIATLRAVVSKY